MSAWIKRNPLVAYFLITYAFSWAIAIPLAARALGALDLPLPFALHYRPANLARTARPVAPSPGRVRLA